MYAAYVCKLTNVRPHPNADRIKLATVFGNQIVVGLDSQEGDIGIYFPTDGQLSEDYAKANNLVGYTDPETGEHKGGFFAENRRVRTQKFRGEKSDGYFAPLSSLDFFKPTKKELEVGFVFDSINGIKICQKYFIPVKHSGGGSHNKTKKKHQKNIMFKEHFDTEQWAYNKHKLQPNSLAILTLKQHGTSMRTGRVKEQIEDISFFKRIIRIVKKQDIQQWKVISGTRRVELGDGFSEEGFYGNNSFRKKHHDILAPNLHKGETVFYEVVGWVNKDTPIMLIADNKKIQDKEFVKRYGDKTIFTYGCPEGESDMYVYRITQTNEDGKSFELPWSAVKERCKELGVKTVPELAVVFNPTVADIDTLIDFHVEGPDLIDPTHIREGVVIRLENIGKEIYCLKHKNFFFKCLEGIVKDNGVADIEEAEEEKKE
jgi:hypothetical protein